MSNYRKALKNAEDRTAYRKVLRNAVGCGRCPIHDGENRKRRPRDDRHKNHRRGRA